MNYPEIYAVDFDKTINLADTYPELGDPNMKLINFLKERREAGDKIILWTCREGELLKEAVKYCNDYGLFFHAVNDNLPENIEYYENNCRKIWAHHYIDDRNYTGHIKINKEMGNVHRLTKRIYTGDTEVICFTEGQYGDTTTAAEMGYKDIRKCMRALAEYEDTGLTPKQIRELVDRDTEKEPQYEGDGYSEGEMVYDIWICPNCGTKYEVDYDDYDFCPDCGQRILRRNKDAETGTSVQRAAL